MRLMVTGGAGFIGATLIPLAISRGHSVLNVDKLTYAANLDNLKSVDSHPNYTFEQADICDGRHMANLLKSFRPDVVLNLAAESHVDRSIDGPATFIKTNINGTFTLLEAVRDYAGSSLAPSSGVRFHHVSTDEVFGSLGPTGAFTETSTFKPNSPYSASKAASDMLVRAWGKTYGMDIVISNCSNNYGPFQFPEKLIPVVLEKARTGQPIPVYGDGSNIRDWLYVGDHAEALLLIAAKGKSGETYNVGGRVELTNLDLVKKICARLDDLFPGSRNGKYENLITFVTDRPGHDRRYAVDSSKIENALGWTAQTDFDEGLAATVDWYLANQDWTDAIKARGHTSARIGLKTAKGKAQ